MSGMLFAEFAILFHFEPFGVVLFILKSIVVSLLAFRTRQSNLVSCAFCRHNAPSKHEKITPRIRDADLFYHRRGYMSIFFRIFLNKFTKKQQKPSKTHKTGIK